MLVFYQGICPNPIFFHMLSTPGWFSSLKMSVLCHRKPYFTGIFHTNGWCPEFPENWMATLVAIFIFCNKWL